MNDIQTNHSKLAREIEKDLKNLMIDYNIAQVIKMTLCEKIDLKK